MPSDLATESSSPTLIPAWIAWVTTDAPRRLAVATIQDYQRQVRAFARWMETTLEVAFTAESITPYRLEQYVASLEGQVFRKCRKPATVNKAVAALTLLGAWLVTTETCADTPARRLRTMEEQPGPPKALPPTVVTKLLDAAHHTGDLRDAVVIEILAFSGMRASEVAAIHLEDLEVGRRTTWVQLMGKGHKRRRVPLPKRVGTLIQQYLDVRMATEGHRPTTGPLLMGERGGITRTTINRTVSTVAARAHLTPVERALVTPHAFRHSVATLLVRTHDLVTVADLLGHQSLSTTRRYSKATAQDLEAAVETLYPEP